MRESVRAIVVKDNALLAMRRNKHGHEFYALVGGGIDEGETAEQALYREVAEEASLQIANLRLVITLIAGPRFGRQYVYLCEYVSGDPMLTPDSPEAASTRGGDNYYQPLWLPLAELAGVDFLPKELQRLLLKCLPNRFPPMPISLMITE